MIPKLLRACWAAVLLLACWPDSQAWAASPSVVSVAVPANGTYGLGRNLDFTVSWDMGVTVTGSPQIAITLDVGGTVYANYLSGSGTSAMLFRYTIGAGNTDSTGIAVGALSLNGGTIRDAATGLDDATLTLNSVSSTTNVLVDTTLPTLPAANIVTNNQTDPQQIRLTFSENLDAATLGAPAQWVVTSHDGSIIFAPAAVSLSSGKIVQLTLPPVDGGNLSTMITNALAVGHPKVTPPPALADLAGNLYAAGLVTESGAAHILDTTPPVIGALGTSSVSQGSAALRVDTSEKGRLFWIAVPAGSAAPTEAQVRAGANYGAVALLAHDITGVGSGPASSFSASGLPSGVALDFYVAVNDAAGNAAGTVLQASFSTPAVSSRGIPALSPWGLVCLSVLSTLLGLVALRRRL